MKTKLATIIADPTFRRGLNMLLKEIKDIELIAESYESKDFLNLSLKPDLIILDTTTRFTEGLNDATLLVNHIPGLKVILLTHHDVTASQLVTVDSCVHAFLKKPFSLLELTSTIKGVIDLESKQN
jgi:DNA-binding NarL/FixJ family response regulator